MLTEKICSSKRKTVRLLATSFLVLWATACATPSTPSKRNPQNPGRPQKQSMGRGAGAQPTPAPVTSAPPLSTPPSNSELRAGSPVPGESEALPEKEKLAYREIYSLYTGAGYEAALIKISEFETQFTQSSLTPQVLNIRGLIYLFSKQPVQAQNQFRKALQGRVDARFKQFLRYNLAASLAETENNAEALSTLEEIQPDQLDAPTQIKYHYLRARMKTLSGSPTDASRSLLVGFALITDPQSPNVKLYETQLEASLKEIHDYPTLEILTRESGSSPLTPFFLLRLAQVASETGKHSLAEAHLHTLETQYPQSAPAKEADDLLSKVSKLSNVSGRSVGVLLPMTGKFSKFGSQSRQGIELAFGKNSQSLIFEDSGDTPESTLKALETLVLDKGVIAVIGPLLSKGLEQVSTRAQELGVPLITLAQQNAKKGDYVFQASVTPEQQVEEIATFAVQSLKIKKFAIVYPNSKFGQDYAQSFWDKVEALGGEVTGFESYSPKETDFRSPIDRISGLHYEDARQREVNELTKLRKENKITKRTRKTENYFGLKPIVDYEAVFIPDEAKVVGQIMPTFLYRDVENVKYLGISTWNSTALAERTGPQGDSAFFTDSFFQDSLALEARDFVQRYQETYDTKPTALEATAFDAASIVNAVFESKKGDLSRSEAQKLLTQIKNFPGVTGKISYLNGEYRRPLRILTVSKGQIVELKRK